jgi:class 3 adenylate cyclase
VTDVWHSTDLLEKVGTESWVEMMDQMLQLLEAEVYHFGGEVDQFRGDGLVAFFGATAAHEDDPERAVLAALGMQRAVESHATDLKEGVKPSPQGAEDDLDLRVRVGVNTGELIVTSIGGHRYREDTAMGEAITVAARMEAAAEPGTVLVSENTYRLVESQFSWQSLGQITVQGVKRPISVHRPLALRPDATWSHQRQIYGSAVPLIGREREFKTLRRTIKDLYDGRGRIVSVTGEKGMGKTFLVANVRQYFEREGMLLAEAHSRDIDPRPTATEADPCCPPQVTWLRGRCRSYDQSWPYSVWLDMLQDWLGMRYEEPMKTGRSLDVQKKEIATRLLERSQQLWGEHASRWADYYPYLATFLSLPLEQEFMRRIQHLDAERLQRQFFAAVRSWVEELARSGPLVLTFADMHWADTSSLELLKYCLPLCDQHSLLWLLVFRPDRASPVWDFRHYLETEYPHRLTDLSVPALTEEQSVEFITRLIGAGTLPEETLDLVIEKAEGNPYYIKELVNALVAQGVLIRDPETREWHSTRPVTTLDLPDSLQNLLLARIDRLSAEEQQVLQAASVVGNVFWHNILAAILPEGTRLEERLTSLQRWQLVHERRRVPDLGREYAFNSSLVRDVAYDSLLRARREAHHLAAAEYLETTLASEEGEDGQHPEGRRYGMVAYHYRQAERLEEALSYTLKAAEQAKTFYANAEALGHYNHALELLDELMARVAQEDAQAQYHLQRRRFAVLNQRRAVYYLLGRLAAGRADARTMLDLARQLEHAPQLLVDALLEQPGVGSIQGPDERDAGIGMAQEALDLARDLGDRHREMRSLMALANLQNLRNDPAWQKTGHEALDLARELGDQRAEAEILLGLGWAYGTDNFERSLSYFEMALPILRGADDKRAEIALLNAMRMPLERSGDYYRMLTEYDRKRLQLSREISDHYAEGHALMMCGQIEGLWLGDYAAGFALEEEALDILSGTTGSLYPLLRIAQIQAALGQVDEALATLERAEPVVEREVQELGRAGFELVRAVVWNALGDAEHLRLAIDTTADVRHMVDEKLVSEQYGIGALCEEAAAHLGLAAVLADEGEKEAHRHAALAASQAALDIYEDFGFVQIVECASEEVLFRHSLALSSTGQIEAAQTFLKRAYDEMMRKHALIPPNSHYRQTYLENIPLHQDIRTAYAVASLRLTWDGARVRFDFGE